MKGVAQWINWRIEDRGGKKPAKVPFDITTGERIDPLDHRKWLPYELAGALSPGMIGFVLTPSAGYWCLDIDDAWNGSAWSDWAVSALQWFPGAYIEVSQSGRGLHIIGRGTVSPGFKTKNAARTYELYNHSRFIAITFTNAQGNCDLDFTAELAQFVPAHFEPSNALPVPGGLLWTTAPVDDATPIADDAELVQRMIGARASAGVAFGGKASAADLWNNNVEALAEAWPSQTDEYDRSSADAALAAHLAFWTGKDCERIARLMGLSKLARPKWERDDYLKRTIGGAAARTSRVYTGESEAHRRAVQLNENIRIGDDVTEPALPAVLTLDDMLARLVFVGQSGAVVDSANGRVRRKESAQDEYAASRHTYVDTAGKEKEAPALKLWLQDKHRVTVDVIAWVPGQAQYCRPPEAVEGATRAFNTWRGLPAPEAPANWQELARPFIAHLEYLAPIEIERDRFVKWLAHIVQRPEVLPHTAYLMIAEQTGIGRNLLASILVRVLRGYVAAGIALDAVLDGGFNGRLSQKLLAIVDEVREGMGERRYQRGERLKSLITEEHRHINVKYGLQSVEKNCCRWLMFSNHHDALPFENTDRRIAVIENPTTRREPSYYAHLYGLIDNPHFIASVRRFLDGVDISTFNPGEHAQMNDAKRKSLDSMLSEVDRAVIDYRDSCVAPITTRGAIRLAVQQATGSSPAENHLTHAITRAGMINATHRVKMYGASQSLVIVRNELTADELRQLSPTVIMQMLGAPAHPNAPIL